MFFRCTERPWIDTPAYRSLVSLFGVFANKVYTLIRKLLQELSNRGVLFGLRETQNIFPAPSTTRIHFLTFLDLSKTYGMTTRWNRLKETVALQMRTSSRWTSA